MRKSDNQKSVLRSYKASWDGELVLVCTKCRRKLKKHKGTQSFANPKKWFKKRTGSDQTPPRVRVVGIDCVKMCPRAGLTVLCQSQLTMQGSEVSILRSEADLEALYSILSLTAHPSPL